MERIRPYLPTLSGSWSSKPPTIGHFSWRTNAYLPYLPPGTIRKQVLAEELVVRLRRG